MDIYKYAARKNLLFPSVKGMLTVTQLFQLDLKNKTGFDLDTVARGISASLKEVDQESFVEDTSADPRKEALAVMLDVVKDVIRTKQEENKAAAEKVRRAGEKRRLLDLINAKKDEKLSQASIEELEKQLAQLEG